MDDLICYALSWIENNYFGPFNIWRQILQCLHVDGDKNEGFGRNKTGTKGN